MGLHQDRDEADFNQPVLSISLGDEALFRIGNETKGGKTESFLAALGRRCLPGWRRPSFLSWDRSYRKRQLYAFKKRW